ncbi:hypothetical protein LDG_8008 [Legionella drancourtii LLAP12]|uniref:Uncharacterized protein n=1 Tax=Legionella drancourtii LLAP12 TaxID=658187 RepID=G9ERU0_9GAMM|nr:hypothetical protein LDG_8008 [Legionella drancourtii LLAP12]
METKRKLSTHCLETFSPQKLSKSFQTIDDFFCSCKGAQHSITAG